eukprot:m.119027 g.119027  ORF g.119027 m.119027 type:complete len:454 (-) comp23157_c0_seq2:112-1473(-)
MLQSLIVAATIALAMASSACLNATLHPGMNVHGGGDFYHTNTITTPEACLALCCSKPPCQSFTFTSSQPHGTKGCDQGKPCCWLKASHASLVPEPNATSALVEASPPSPPSPPPPRPAGVATFNLTFVRTLVELNDAQLRDPTTPICLPDGGGCHFWATHINASLHEQSGYYGTVYYFYCLDDDCFSSSSTWKNGGQTIGINKTNPDAFDAFGTFTPGALFDSATNTWVLMYGAVGNNFTRDWKYRNFSEEQGLAYSSSPRGPWVRSKFNPVVSYDSQNQSAWNGVRVDNPRLYVINGSRQVYLKVIGTGKAGDIARIGVLLPHAAPDLPSNPWSGPLTFDRFAYTVNTSLSSRGMENQEVFFGPDKLLHMIGSYHSCVRSPLHNCSGQPHFVSSDLGRSWTWVEDLRLEGEPVPVYFKHPAPNPTDIPRWFINRSTCSGRLCIGLYEATWNM